MSKIKKFCEACGTSLAANDRFCPECGATSPTPSPITSTKFCDQCGKPLSPEDNFCQDCGSRNSPQAG